MDKKNILYLRTDLGTKELSGGGSVAHTIGVIDGFIKLGHHVTCVSSAMHKLLQRYTFFPLALPAILKPLGFKLNCILSNAFFYLKVERFVKNHKIDVIYQRYSMLNVVGAWISQRYKVSLILEFNGSEAWMDEHWSPHRKIKLVQLVRWAEAYNLRHAHRIIVVSSVLKEQLVSCGVSADKIVINPNGVDTQLFDPERLQKQRIQQRIQLGCKDAYLFGFSGTFSYWHGIDLLDQMIPLVLKCRPKARFLLIGDGQLKAHLQSTLRQKGLLDRVIFTGMVHSDRMPALLASCDAFLCPTQPNSDGSPFFGSPTKLFEYMAMKKPILLSDLAPLRELMPIQEALFVAHDNVDGFVRAALSLIDLADDEQQRLGRSVRKQALEHYTWEQHCKRIMFF